MTNELQEDVENVLWESISQKKKGIIRRKVVSTNRVAITNRRIIVNDHTLLLQDVSDVVVVVLNRRRSGDAQYTGYSVRTSHNVRVGSHQGNIKSQSRMIGDLVHLPCGFSLLGSKTHHAI